MKVMESRGRARGHDGIFIMGSPRNQEDGDGVVLAPDQAARCHGSKSLTELDNPPCGKAFVWRSMDLQSLRNNRIDMSLG